MNLSDVLEEFKKDVLDAVRNNENVVILPMTTLLAAIKRRVHNDGIASDGSTIANSYNPIYERIRAAKGRQVSYVDLEVFGNLRNNLDVHTIGKNFAIGFTNDEQLIIATSHEERYGKPIFSPTDEEEDDFFDNLLDQIEQHIR